MISSGSLSNADTSFVDGFSIDDLVIPSTVSGMLTVVMRRPALYSSGRVLIIIGINRRLAPELVSLCSQARKEGSSI